MKRDVMFSRLRAVLLSSLYLAGHPPVLLLPMSSSGQKIRRALPRMPWTGRRGDRGCSFSVKKISQADLLGEDLRG